MRIIGPYVSPGKILLANSLRLLPLHCVERAGARKLRGSFTKAAALWILLANSLRLLPLHAVERAGARKLRGSFTKAAALWIRQQYPEGWRPQGARQFHTTELH